jgi:hypothetical protein
MRDREKKSQLVFSLVSDFEPQENFINVDIFTNVFSFLQFKPTKQLFSTC